MQKLLLIATSLLALAPVHAQSEKTKDEGWSDLLPPGDARQSVMESCTSCHNLKVVVLARKNRTEWGKAVNDMVQRGAQLFPEEIEPITNYLVKVCGQDVPKLVNVNTATREELAGLPNMNPGLVTQILDARGKAGPFKSADDLRQALKLDQAGFEKIRYLLKYRD
jgi:DNA uptake protein ComE-like DNA-binding protein